MQYGETRAENRAHIDCLPAYYDSPGGTRPAQGNKPAGAVSFGIDSKGREQP